MKVKHFSLLTVVFLLCIGNTTLNGFYYGDDADSSANLSSAGGSWWDYINPWSYGATPAIPAGAPVPKQESVVDISDFAAIQEQTSPNSGDYWWNPFGYLPSLTGAVKDRSDQISHSAGEQATQGALGVFQDPKYVVPASAAIIGTTAAAAGIGALTVWGINELQKKAENDKKAKRGTNQTLVTSSLLEMALPSAERREDTMKLYRDKVFSDEKIYGKNFAQSLKSNLNDTAIKNIAARTDEFSSSEISGLFDAIRAEALKTKDKAVTPEIINTAVNKAIEKHKTLSQVGL